MYGGSAVTMAGSRCMTRLMGMRLRNWQSTCVSIVWLWTAAQRLYSVEFSNNPHT
jgi:hypothetical protein